MGTKVAVAFANIFMVRNSFNITLVKKKKPVWWKKYIDQTTSSLFGISEENN